MIYQLSDESIGEVCGLIRKILVNQTRKQSGILWGYAPYDLAASLKGYGKLEGKETKKRNQKTPSGELPPKSGRKKESPPVRNATGDIFYIRTKR
jgi:hypothetical protein